LSSFPLIHYSIYPHSRTICRSTEIIYITRTKYQSAQ
jgi:hypothetical protein